VPDASLRVIPVGAGSSVELHRLDTLGTQEGRIIARHPQPFSAPHFPAFDPSGRLLALADSGGNLCLWPLDGDGQNPERCIEGPSMTWQLAFSPGGSLLAQAAGTTGGRLWDLRGPAGSAPLQLGRPGPQMNAVAFSPDGRWLASTTTAGGLEVALWPMTHRYPRVLSTPKGGVGDLVFSVDGARLFGQGAIDGNLWAWDLEAGAGAEPAMVFQTDRGPGQGLRLDPKGRYLLWHGMQNWIVPLDGSAPSPIESGPQYRFGLGPEGRYLPWTESEKIIIFDLESGERQKLTPPGEGDVFSCRFDSTGKLVVTRDGTVSRWDPGTRDYEILIKRLRGAAYPWGDDRRIYVSTGGGAEAGVRYILDLEDGKRIELADHQPPCFIWRNDSGSIVASGHPDGELRVGPVADERAHLLLGHQSQITGFSIAPDGQWIATSSQDGTIRLWPMPDLTKQPLHTLPLAELVTELKAFTNLRAVPDEDSRTGYRIEPDFAASRGWATAPEW
jgi:WD40 repeat protein